ncbi:MAG: hypothetical protein AAF596_05010 [Planctomycetota bacterium]
MSTKSVVGGFGALAAVAFGLAAVIAVLTPSIDPEIAELRVMRQHMFAVGSPSVSEREEFRQRVALLSDSQRRDFFHRSQPDMMKVMRQRMDKFFGQSPTNMRLEVSGRADEIVAQREERAAGDAEGGRRGPAGRLAEMSANERDSFRKQLLDRTDPEMRAQISEYRRLVDRELTSRGEQPVRGPEMQAMMGGGPPASGRPS